MRGFNSTLQSKPAKSRSPWQTDDRKSPYSTHSKSPHERDETESPLNIIFGKKAVDNDLMKTQRNPMSAKEWTPPGFSNRKSPVSQLKYAAF